MTRCSWTFYRRWDISSWWCRPHRRGPPCDTRCSPSWCGDSSAGRPWVRRAKAKIGVVLLLPSSAASSKRERSMAMAAISVAEAEQLLHRSVPPWMLALQLQVRATTAESATLVMPFDEQLLRPGRIIAGQALMALADTAMVLALWSALG